MFHQLENFVFIAADILLGKLDLVHQGLVLVVSFDLKRLVAVLGDFALQVLDSGFEFAASRFIGLDGGTGLLEVGPGTGQFFFNFGDALREFSNFGLKAGDFAVGLLHGNEVFNIRKHWMA